MAKILWITVEGRGEQGTYTDEVFIVFENVFTTASSRIVIKHFPWTQTCLIRVSCRCATRQIFLISSWISGCFDSVWVIGQCIEELIDNILLDDTPSVACFFFQGRKMPWYEFESSDCWDKTVRHLLCWRQVAHKITVLKLYRVLRKFWTNSKDNYLYLRAWHENCLSDIACTKSRQTGRSEVWYDFYFHSGKKDSVISRGGKGPHLDCQRTAWRWSQHRNN